MNRLTILLLITGLGFFITGQEGCKTDDDADGSQACGINEDPYGGTCDCDDNNDTVYPGAEEVCDSMDNNCNGEVDEGVSQIWYADLDADGFGNPGDTVEGECTAPDGYVADSADCNDADSNVNPAATEVCDGYGIDENCNGMSNDDDPTTDPSSQTLYFFDADQDGFGDPTNTLLACTDPSSGSDSWFLEGTDCDDGDASVYPGADEVCDDGIDQDCDGEDESPCQTSTVIPLEESDSILVGQPYDLSGYSASSAGDVNGDGFDDLVVGAYGSSLGGEGSGAAYLWYGPVGSGQISSSLADATFVGETVADSAGYSVSGAGDVNGDGYDDILIGAYGQDTHGYYAGATYVIYGRSSVYSGSNSLSSAGAKIVGESEGDYSGWTVSGAGDVNADGYDDILVSAIWDDEGGEYAGAAYLLYGPLSGQTSLSSAGAKLIGEAGYNYAGWSLSGAGDVNGDGYDDILIGATWNSRGGSYAGSAYLIFGPVEGTVSLADADAILVGEGVGDGAGGAVSSAGDHNQDGYADILIGAEGNSSGGADAGAAYLLYGPVEGVIDLAAADAKFEGDVAGSQAGSSLAFAGDVNLDGYGDLIIGADGSGTDASLTGSAYLILGHGAEFSGTIPLYMADYTLEGTRGGDHAGCSVGQAGDVNGDGYGDVFVGAWANEAGGEDAGTVYVVNGGFDQGE